MPWLVATVACTAAVVAVGLRSRLGLGPALMVGFAGALLGASAVAIGCLDHDAFVRERLQLGLLLVFGGWALAVVGLRRRWPARADPRRASGGAIAAALAVLALGVGLRLDPSPYLHGGQDQGIYVNVGHHIARTGRLRPVDRLLAGEVPGFPAADIHATHKIKPLPEGSPLIGVREGRWIAGLHVEDASEGRIVPGFFHLLPAWFALAELDLGFARSTWPLVLFAALAQLAAFALAYRITAGDSPTPERHRRAFAVGLIAALGLALHPLDLWISTFPVTENLARACLLGAAALGLEAARAERLGQAGAGLLGALAGLLFAAGAFARGSMLALAIGLALALLLVRSETPRSRRAILLALVVGATLAAIQAIVHSWPYFFSAASNHFHVPRIQPSKPEAVAWAIVAGACVLLGDLALGVVRRRWFEPGDRPVRILGMLLLLAAAAAMIYRGFDQTDAYGPQQQVAAVLLRYCGPVMLALALLGLALALVRARAGELAWVLLACGIVLLSALKEGVRYEFYYARYLVGDAIPVLVIAAACTTGALLARARARAWLLAAIVLLAWHLPGLARLRHPVFWTRDLEHGPEDLTAMFEHVPDDAVLIFDARAPGRWRGILATPAFLSFGKTVMVYPSTSLVEQGITAGTPMVLLSGGWEDSDHQRWPDRGPWHTTVVARGVYRAQRAEVVEGAMPTALTEWGGPWELLQIDRSIWRGNGAFSLYPESRFIAEVPASGVGGAGRVASERVELRWQPGWFAELLVEPGGLDDCEVAARIVGDEVWALARTSSPTGNRVRFALPGSREDAIASKIEFAWTCARPRAVIWRRLSVRGE